ncbi:SDR family NAD(P)-dependent oxidoreductase [Aurantivibrio plasticivorans]
MGRLNSKVAVITGGTSGIGEATAELFVKEGCKVVLTGRSREKGEALANKLGENARYYAMDVTKEEEIASAFQFACDTFGQLDIVFNNAGASRASTLETITKDDIQFGVDTLLSSVILGIKHAIPYLKDNGGSIINNASIAGHRYRQGNLLYSGLKAAVAHYSRLAGVELGPLNIRVNCISPGAIATPIFWGGSQRANTMSEEENATKLKKLQDNLANATPLPSAGLAIDIANGALFLASEEGRFINSHDLVIDGGRIAMFNEG